MIGEHPRLCASYYCLGSRVPTCTMFKPPVFTFQQCQHQKHPFGEASGHRERDYTSKLYTLALSGVSGRRLIGSCFR